MFAQLVSSARAALPVLFGLSSKHLSIKNFVRELGELEPRILDHLEARPGITINQLRALKLSECGLSEQAERFGFIDQVGAHYGIALSPKKRLEIAVFDRPLGELRCAVHKAMLKQPGLGVSNAAS